MRSAGFSTTFWAGSLLAALAELCQQNEGAAIVSPLRSEGGTRVLQAPAPNHVTPIRVAQVHKVGRLMTCEEIEGRHCRPSLTRSGSSTPGGIGAEPPAVQPARSWVFAFPVVASWKDSLDGGDGYLSPHARFQNAERVDRDKWFCGWRRRRSGSVGRQLCMTKLRCATTGQPSIGQREKSRGGRKSSVAVPS